MHTIRTHKGPDHKSHCSVFQKEDDTGKVGVALSKDLMVVAGEALKTNITKLGPSVLPVSEQIKFLVSLVARKVYIRDESQALCSPSSISAFIPVLDAVEKNFVLSVWHVEPSRMTLYRFDNTSSSTLWHELAYLEAKRRIRKGDKTWQIAFGAGLKCNSAIWRAVRLIESAKEKNPWTDEINEFPVDC